MACSCRSRQMDVDTEASWLRNFFELCAVDHHDPPVTLSMTPFDSQVLNI